MEWWKNRNGILQIYPRSFYDANGDGVGDLRGIIEKLDYVKGQPDSLGIDAIWLSPFYPSPMADFGYDISDYCDVNELFGSLDDAKELIAKAHERDIAIMIDIVPNHTSNQHPWFIEAINNPDSPKRDYYIFREGKDGGFPNNWHSVFGGPAWEHDERTGQYYLHSFLAEQPDLNWNNPEVQEEFKKILRFWIDLGVDGFRADAVRWMAKSPHFENDIETDEFRNGNRQYWLLKHNHSRYGEKLDAYLRVMTQTVKEAGSKIILFEDYLDDHFDATDQIVRMYGIDPSVSAPFNFEVLESNGTARELAKIIANYELLTPNQSASVYCFGNHDKPRLISRLGSERARIVSFLQLTLPGLPVIYYGDEIGMQDAEIPEERIQDPYEKRVPGHGLGRDPARTPMQWNGNTHAGFTTAPQPWLPVEASYSETNVEAVRKDPQSLFTMFKKLLSLRSSSETLRKGLYHEAYVDDDLLMFARVRGEDQYLVVCNLSENERTVELPRHGEVVTGAKNVALTETKSENVTSIDPFDGVLIHFPAPVQNSH